ncbi:unnamed protein product [Caenorhabditis auriculariae]|uniref:Uncharacterized protein n=1 Tax=Caenorhabditis auriculariae TaxID=2777116 RepID=A0A8S1H1C3_9PELO|nr:unnamed protein product [Caenorhabditis auriculariae]
MLSSRRMVIGGHLYATGYYLYGTWIVPDRYLDATGYVPGIRDCHWLAHRSVLSDKAGTKNNDPGSNSRLSARNRECQEKEGEPAGKSHNTVFRSRLSSFDRETRRSNAGWV